jgi:uncharacterized protein with von Willebrand factor type A (vWA) domain
MMFLDLLFALRRQGLPVGTSEWLGFLDGVDHGLATDVTSLRRLGRALLCRTEADFDAYDLAWAEVFGDASLPDDLREKLEAWLTSREAALAGETVVHQLSPQELWQAFLERLREQKERHEGGARFIGTRGTSPLGQGGRAEGGLRAGGDAAGGRTGMAMLDRPWANYRTDRVIDVRDLQVALRALRNLTREGRYQLDLPGTIRKTCDNAGDVEIVEERERQNQVHVVLLTDAGGSMAPHYERVAQLFAAAEKLKTFKTFKHYSFHNCVYGWLYEDMETLQRVRTEEVLAGLTPRHRLIFVGDASMAPYELFTPYSWPGEGGIAGIEWLRRLRQRCPASVWINPDPPRFWNHPTVRAIGHLIPMMPLTLDGVRSAVKLLRAPF